MKWGLLRVFFSLYLGFAASSSAFAIGSDVFADQQLSLRLRDGHTVQLYFPEKNKSIQEWVDRQTYMMLSTDIGLALCKQVLGSDVSALQDYLAVSNNMALQIALMCTKHKGGHLYVDNFKVSGPIKMTKNVAFEKRHYQFLLSEQNLWPFDSWTDAATNQTVIIAQGPKRQDDTLYFQAMAHEFAIYFDGQYSVGTKEWWDIHSGKKFTIITPKRERLFLAANNPIIAAILSYMRAFRVEQQILSDMSVRNLSDMGETILSYPYASSAFEFLSEKCDHNCLMNFVKSQSVALSPYALALMAYSGSYKDKRIAELIKVSPARGHLLKFAVDNFNARVSGHSQYNLLPFIALAESMDTWLPRQLVSPIQDLFNESILPADLTVLDEARVFLPDTGETISFLQWILRPVLSGRNVDFSSGPRPRIRTGGGGYGN